MQDYLTPEEVGDRLRVKPTTVLSWLRSGKMKGIQLAGRLWRIEPAALEEFVSRGKGDANAAKAAE